MRTNATNCAVENEIPPMLNNALNQRQRLANYLTIAVTLALLSVGFFVRSGDLNATRAYQEAQSGITARYPAGWIIEERTRDFLFRVQDVTAIPFKTSIRVQIVPIGAAARPADVLNELTINRANRLQSYQSLGIEPITLANGAVGDLQSYAYAALERNPFLQSVPIIVRANDVVILRGTQAIVITYEADANTFESNRQYFINFLNTLQF